MTATPDKPRRHPNTAFRSIGEDGGLVVLPGRAEVKVLNPVAIKVFELLDGQHTVEEIASEVTEEFEIDGSQAAEDIRAFVKTLQDHGMLAGEAEMPNKGSSA